MALPRRSIRRGLVSMSSRMSWTICLARGSALTTFCIVPQRFFSSALLRSVMPLVLSFEPLVDLLRRGQVLVDVARLVAQIEHDAVLDGLIELVGVDEAAERLDAGRLVGLEQRRAGEADEHRARQQLLHGVVHLARLGAVRLVDEHEEIALGLKVLGDLGVQLVDEVVARPRRDRRRRRRRGTCGPASRSATRCDLFSVSSRSAPLLVR